MALALFAIWGLTRKNLAFCEFVSDALKGISTRRERVTSIMKLLTVYMAAHLIIWSVLNFWFYINLYILVEHLQYPMLRSFRIAINMTGQYQSIWYWIKHIILHSSLSIDSIPPNFENTVNNIVHQMDTLDAIDSEFRLTLDIIKMLL
jgi:hypothetical protein